MKIFSSPYKLISSTLNVQGLLLKYDFSHRGIGYACLQPWENLGDQSITDQLQELKMGGLTPQLEQCLRLAQEDANARSARVELLTDLKTPLSHYFINRDLRNIDLDFMKHKVLEGFHHFKIKVGENEFELISFLKRVSGFLKESESKIRLDFNEKLSEAQAFQLLNQIYSEKLDQAIDFIEDVCPFKTSTWLDFKNKFPIPLAVDRELIRNKSISLTDLKPADVLIIKPSHLFYKDLVSKIKGSDLKVVFTTNLEHPLGIAATHYDVATACADLELKKHIDVCGLISHDDFKSVGEASYFEEIQIIGQKLHFNKGIGFGFDGLLKQRVWEPIL